MNELSPIDVESKIITLRGQQVILDCDVAELYGVETKVINQAVKNNPEKFPKGYVFQLDVQEINSLRSNFLTLKVHFRLRCNFCTLEIPPRLSYNFYNSEFHSAHLL